MKNNYSYIGAFEIDGGSLLVGDPYINGVTVAMEKIPSENEIPKSIPHMKNGIYYAYHVVDPIDGAIVSLLLSHKDAIIGDLEKTQASFCGSVVVSLGNAVVAVDKSHLFDTTGCYYSFSENAYYGCDRLLREIPNMDYPDEMKDEMLRLVHKALDQQLPAVSGDKIGEIIGACPIWDGFRGFGRDCSLWSVEILESLSCAYRNAEIIKGGVASLAGSEKLSVFRYKDPRDSSESACNVAALITLCPD